MERQFPFVSHGRTDFSQEHSFVGYDNEAFSHMAVMRLADKGCRKLCIILPPDKLSFHQHLKYGFMRTVRNLGIDCFIPENINLDDSSECISDWAMGIAKTAQPPDGFICAGEISYFSVLSGFRRAESPLKDLPEFVVKTTTGLMQQIAPDVDRIHENISQAGHAMAAQLLLQLTKPNAEITQKVFDPVAGFLVIPSKSATYHP